MAKTTPLPFFVHVLLLVVVTVSARFILLSPAGLNDDEAYYWMWSHMPSLSYYDNTPGAGWFLIPFMWLLGDSLISIRAITGVTAALTCVAITLAVSALTPSLSLKHKIQILWLSAASGLVMLMTLIWTPDTPLLLFSALAFWQLFKAIENNDHWAWVWTGLFFSLAFLAKANSGLYIAIIGIWMLAHPKGRQQLSTPWPWVGCLIILLALVPILIWNIENDWVFFKFQGGHAFAPTSTDTPSDSSSWAFIRFDQLALLFLSYLLFAGLTVIVSFNKLRPSRHLAGKLSASHHLVFSLILSSTLLFSAISLYKTFSANWAIITVLLLLIIGLSELIKCKPRIIWLQIIAALPPLALIISLNFIPSTVSLAFNWKHSLVWDEIYQIMRFEQAKLPDNTLLAAIDYQDASQLAFYERPIWSQLPGQHAVPALNLSVRSNHYAHYWPYESYINQDFLFLQDSQKNSDKKHFCSIKTIGFYEVKHLEQSIRKFYLFYGKGLKGRPDTLSGNETEILKCEP